MVYEQDEQFISWLNGLYPGRMVVEAVTTFVRVAAYQAPEGLCLSTSIDSRVELVNQTACTTFAVSGKCFGEILLKWLHADCIW